MSEWQPIRTAPAEGWFWASGLDFGTGPERHYFLAERNGDQIETVPWHDWLQYADLWFPFTPVPTAPEEGKKA